MRNQTTLFLMTLLWLMTAACGGGGGDDTPLPDGATPAVPLTCKSVALCTTHDVKTFTVATLPVAGGGTVADGVYRLAYDLIPNDIGEQPGYFDGLDVLQVRGKHYNWAGFHRDELGTFTTAGTTLTFQQTRDCDRGTDGEPTTRTVEYRYTASATELHLYSRVMRSDGVSWDKVYVYKRTASPDEVCRTVPSDPAAPGDSARCTVSNCACSFAIENTVAACT